MSGPRDYMVNLTAATPFVVEASGRFFGIIDAPDAPLDVALDDGQLLRRGPGGSIYVPAGFARLSLLSSVTQAVRILIADEPQDVSNIVTGSGGITVTVDETPSATLTPAADVAVAAGGTSDIAANLNRKRIHIGADVANADALPLRVRNTAAATAQGAQLQPGQSVMLSTTAAIRIMNPGAVAQTFNVLEES